MVSVKTDIRIGHIPNMSGLYPYLARSEALTVVVVIKSVMWRFVCWYFTTVYQLALLHILDELNSRFPSSPPNEMQTLWTYRSRVNM
jgi:hypothetical protein